MRGSFVEVATAKRSAQIMDRGVQQCGAKLSSRAPESARDPPRACEGEGPVWEGALGTMKVYYITVSS